MNNRVRKILRLAALLAPSLLAGRLTDAPVENIPGSAMEWSSYGGDKASTSYSPVDKNPDVSRTSAIAPKGEFE